MLLTPASLWIPLYIYIYIDVHGLYVYLSIYLYKRVRTRTRDICVVYLCPRVCTVPPFPLSVIVGAHTCRTVGELVPKFNSNRRASIRIEGAVYGRCPQPHGKFFAERSTYTDKNKQINNNNNTGQKKQSALGPRPTKRGYLIDFVNVSTHIPLENLAHVRHQHARIRPSVLVLNKKKNVYITR